MNDDEKKRLLEEAKNCFKEIIGENHIRNTRKLVNPKRFKIHPFLTVYLANFLCGNSSPESIAKALIYPRALGTSITTSFGTNMQTFASRALSSLGSTTSGIDIEFVDAVDGRKKYCQLKAGPNTINKSDIKTVVDHFNAVINLGRTNNVRLSREDFVVGVFYGEEGELSDHYRKIRDEHHYPVIVGIDFWHRLTGDDNFYADLISGLGEVAREANFSSELDAVISRLAATPEIQRLSHEANPPDSGYL